MIRDVSWLWIYKVYLIMKVLTSDTATKPLLEEVICVWYVQPLKSRSTQTGQPGALIRRANTVNKDSLFLSKTLWNSWMFFTVPQKHVKVFTQTSPALHSHSFTFPRCPLRQSSANLQSTAIINTNERDNSSIKCYCVSLRRLAGPHC